MLLAGHTDQLRALIAAQPDRTLVELWAALQTPVGLATIWRATVPAVDAARFVFLDESGVATDLLRRYGRSLRGQRLVDHAPFGHWQTHTILAALRLEGLTAPAVLDGPVDKPSFLAYVEQVLVPTLRPGDIVVLDNLAVH